MNVTGGDTNVSVYFQMRLLAGGDATGLTIADFDLSYTRNGAETAAKADAVQLASASSLHIDNRGYEVDPTDCPGLYRFDFPDAAFAAAVSDVLCTVKHTSCFTETLRVQIDAAVNVTSIEADQQSATDLKDFADAGYDPGTNSIEQCKVNDDMVGTDSAALASVCTEARLSEMDTNVGKMAFVLDATKTVVDLVVIDTAEIGTAGAGLTDLGGMSTAMKAEVNTEADTALSDIHMDHLMAAAAADVVVDGSVIAHMVSATEDWSTFVPSTDALQAIRDRGDASWTTGAGGNLASGTADSGTTTTMVDAALTEADTDYWKGNLIEFTDGTLDGQVRLITDFTPANDTITFYPAATQAVSTHTYQIIAAADGDAKAVILAAIDALGAPVTISTASVSRLQDTSLKAYVDEIVTFPPITPKDVDGTTLDASAIALEVIIENKDQTDVVTIADGDLTKTTTTVQFTAPIEANESEARKYWSIRRIDTGVVVAKGEYVVEYAAIGD